MGIDVIGSILSRFGVVIAVTLLVGLPLGVFATIRVSAHRRAAGWASWWAWRSAASEIGIVLGTAPWVWMIMTPTGGEGGVRLIPFRDLGGVLAGGDAIVQTVGNLLVFAALGFLLPVRFRLGSPSLVLPVVSGVAAVLSAILETLQLVLGLGRVTSVDDVLINALGAAIASSLSFPWWRARGTRLGNARTSETTRP